MKIPLNKTIITGMLAGGLTGCLVAGGLMHVISKILKADEDKYKQSVESVMDNLQTSLNKAQQIITKQAERIDSLNSQLDIMKEAMPYDDGPPAPDYGV